MVLSIQDHKIYSSNFQDLMNEERPVKDVIARLHSCHFRITMDQVIEIAKIIYDNIPQPKESDEFETFLAGFVAERLHDQP